MPCLLTLRNSCDRSDAAGKCWPGIKTIVANLKLSRSTVKRAIADLERFGYLEKEHRHLENGSYTSNLYKVRAKTRPPP